METKLENLIKQEIWKTIKTIPKNGFFIPRNFVPNINLDTISTGNEIEKALFIDEIKNNRKVFLWKFKCVLEINVLTSKWHFYAIGTEVISNGCWDPQKSPRRSSNLGFMFSTNLVKSRKCSSWRKVFPRSWPFPQSGYEWTNKALPGQKCCTIPNIPELPKYQKLMFNYADFPNLTFSSTIPK